MKAAVLVVASLLCLTQGFQMLNPPIWKQQVNETAFPPETDATRLRNRLGYLGSLVPGSLIRDEDIPYECRLPELNRFRSSADDDMINVGASQWNYYETGSVFYGVLGLDSYELSDIQNERIAQEDVIKLTGIFTRSKTLAEEQTDYCDTENAEPSGDFWTPPGGHRIETRRTENTWTALDTESFRLQTKSMAGSGAARPAPRTMDPLKPFATAGDVAPNGVPIQADSAPSAPASDPLVPTVEDPKVMGLVDKGTVTTRPIALAIPAAYYTYVGILALASVVALAYSQYLARQDIPDIDWPDLQFRLNWADTEVLGTDQLANAVQDCLEDVGGCAGPITEGDSEDDIDLCFEGSCLNFNAADSWHRDYPGKAMFQMAVDEPGWLQDAVPFTGLTMMMFEVMGEVSCSPVEMVGLPIPVNSEGFEWDAFDISAVGVSAMLVVGSVGSTVYSLNDPSKGGKPKRGAKGGKVADKIRADATPADEGTKDEHGFSVTEAPAVTPTPTPTPRDPTASPVQGSKSKRLPPGMLQRSSVGSRGSKKGGSVRRGTQNSAGGKKRSSVGSTRSKTSKGSNRARPGPKTGSTGKRGSVGSTRSKGSNRSRGSNRKPRSSAGSKKE